MYEFLQSDPRAAERILYFTAVDNADGKTPIQASDMSGGTWLIYLSKAGAAPAPVAASTPTELDATNQKGVFKLALAIADLDTRGNHVITITNTGGTKTMFRREYQLRVRDAYFFTVVAGLDATQFTCDRAETVNDYWRDVYLEMLTGVCSGQSKKVGGYTGASRLMKLVSGVQFTTQLGTGDIGIIVNR